MQIARVASFIHKWSTLAVGVQILFWIASGAFFALFPIETVRSEHLMRPPEVQALDAAKFAPLVRVRDGEGRVPTRVTYETRPDGPVAVAEFAVGPPALFDARTAQRLSPITPERAAAYARSHVTLTSAQVKVRRVVQASAEYRGALPAYRVQFRESGLAVYVAENTGAVTARRSNLWRVYDALWALHIMDWKDHENFHHPLVAIAAFLALISAVTGIILLPYRLGVGRELAARFQREKRFGSR